MRDMLRWVLVAGFCLFVGSATACWAQEKDSGGTDQEAVMKKWMEFMTPGAEHESLKYKVGKWNMKLEMWMAPDAPPTPSTGTSEMKLIMDGRYLVDTTKSTFNDMPFEGMGIIGFDNLKKRFVSIWIDNMGTGIMTGTGTYDKQKKLYTYSMMAPDIMTGEYKRSRTVERIIDDNQWVTEMYDTAPDGKEFLTMKIVYTREK